MDRKLANMQTSVNSIRGAFTMLKKVDPSLKDRVMVPGKPAKTTQIAKAEKALGVALPAYYRAFLSYTDGLTGLSGDRDLFSIKVLTSTAIASGVARWRSSLDAKVQKKLERAIVIGGNLETLDWIYFDPTRVEPDGEMAIVEWFHDSKPVRHRNLYKFFEKAINKLRWRKNMQV